MRAVWTWAIGLTWVCAGCGYYGEPLRSRPRVELRVEPATAAPGDPITLVLENRSADAVGYNLCTSQLERRTDFGWEDVPADRACTMEIRSLAPGEEARFSLCLETVHATVDHRFWTSVHDLASGTEARIPSQPFGVRE